MRVICSSPSFKMSKKEERKSDFFFFQKTSDSQEKPKSEIRNPAKNPRKEKSHAFVFSTSILYIISFLF